MSLRRASTRSPRRAAFTLVELLLAVALGSILLLALTRLLDTTLSVWSRTEVRRNLAEQSAVVADRLAQDLRGLHGGAQGDLLLEWITYDLDGDGVREQPWPRLRLVRQASPGEVERLARGSERPLLDVGLMEVCWAALPASKEVDARSEARLLRGERLLDDDQRSFFAQDFFDSLGSPPAGALDLVSDGLLWLCLRCAGEDSDLAAGEWTIGRAPEEVSGCWDAWRRGRPDPFLHRWNEPTEEQAALEGRPRLPRRVRIELEFERAEDRARRTRLRDSLDATTTRFEVDNGRYLPREEGAHVLIEREWMEVLGVEGDTLRVRRGTRGTDAALHGRGTMVHHGATWVTEVVPPHEELWSR